MPYRVNGTGTWYYGKKNLYSYQGVCPYCGAKTKLKSYDTTEFFTLFFIPVIPLGEKRVIDECNFCSKHRVLKLKEWEKFSQDKINELHTKWLADPQNAENVINLLDAITYFQAADKLNAITDGIKKYCYADPKALYKLGKAHAFFNQLDPAISAFNAALAVDPQNDTYKESLAESLIKSLKPAEARPLLTHIFQYGIKDRLYYIYLLIECYQYLGDHNTALQVIQECSYAFPDLKDKNPLVAYQKKSNRSLKSSCKIKGNLISSATSTHKNKKLSFTLPKLVFPALMIILIAIYFINSFFIGISRKVYLVNGLDKPYHVVINGKQIHLEPMTQTVVRLPEGHIEMDISEINPEEKIIDFNIKTNFLTRPLSHPLFIINPDKVAVLFWTETIYTTKDDSSGDYEPPYNYYTGQYFYELKDVYYLFEEFPETIQMRANSEIKRDQLIQLDQEALNSAYEEFLEALNEEDAKSYFEAKLTYDPDNYYDLLTYLLYYCEQEDAVSYLRAKLNDRPVLIHWHRAYQDYMDLMEPDYDLKKEYTEYLENEKDNTVFYYLLARVVENSQEAIELCKKSVEGNDPLPYGYYALANYNLYLGNYEQALEYAEKARDLLPQDLIWQETLNDAMFALGDYDSLLQVTKADQQLDPYSSYLILQEIKLHMAKNDTTSAENAVKRYIDSIISYYKEKSYDHNELIADIHNYLNGLISYYQNDVSLYALLIENLEAPMFKYHHAFIKGDLDTASRIALDNDFDGSYFLLLYLAEDNPDVASKYLSQAIYHYQKDDIYHRLLADYLLQKGDYSPEDMTSLFLHPDEKRIALAALAKLNSSYKEELLSYAKKLNYNIDFPYHFIKKLTEENK